MSAALKRTNPTKTILGFASVKDEKGEEMHKSKGNAVEFNEAANQIGVDVMRWLYASHNPEYNLNFGLGVANEVRRRFYLILWNSYKFFIDYAIATDWQKEKAENLTVLDKWILARLTQVILLVNKSLIKYDAASATRVLEEFLVNDFSTWYIRRSRDRVGPEADEVDRNTTLWIMYEVLVTSSMLLAPFMPFISEEIYVGLTGEESVHLADYPQGDSVLLDENLIKDMMQVRKIAESAHAKRKEAGIRLRQPLASVLYKLPQKLDPKLEKILTEELNVKKVEYLKSSEVEPEIKLDTNITHELAQEGMARDLIRQVQQLRKEQGLTLTDRTSIISPSWPAAFENQILASTASVSIEKGPDFKVLKIDENPKKR